MIPDPAEQSPGLAGLASLGPSRSLLPPVAASGTRPATPWRRLVEWSPTSAPVALLLLAGIALGPQGIHLLSADALSILAPAIPVALAALGVLVAVSAESGRRDNRRALATASLLAAFTILVVSGGLAAFALVGTIDIPSVWIIVAGAGICAASSVTLPPGTRFERRTSAARLAELGVLLPILVGGAMLAWLRSGTAWAGPAVLVAAAGLTCALALATWLLLTVASSETEERVLTVSALLLVGGVADALSMSALLMGVVAGLFWRYADQRPAETIGRDVLFVQHPLLVLVLLAAGANANLSAASMTLGVAYLSLRLVGQLAGGLIARRAGAMGVAADLSVQLLPPGVFGVAFALNLASVGGPDASVLLAAVVVGTVASELVAAFFPHRGVSA